MGDLKSIIDGKTLKNLPYMLAFIIRWELFSMDERGRLIFLSLSKFLT